jgi:two-component system, OmpR family, response regulator
MPTILIVDDEAHIRDVVQYALIREGFETRSCEDGQRALDELAKGGIDLIILDVLMPELDGLSVCRKIRQSSSLPIIFLSSRGDEVDRIIGLELGGDDYLPKPFSPRELATRVKTVLRRSAACEKEPHTPEAPKLTYHQLTLDVARHEATIGQERIEFTVTEFALLRAVIESQGRVLSRTQLIDRAYSELTHITERTVDTHIRRIRQKLRAYHLDPIETVHGLGYKCAP